MIQQLVLASVALIAASVLTGCFPFYRYQSAACKQRGVAYAARVEKLRRDARQRLIIGAKKEVVIHFFAENDIPVSFVAGEATGRISTTGRAPAGCGSDAALLGLRVKVDQMGAVTGEPVVGALYTDCL